MDWDNLEKRIEESKLERARLMKAFFDTDPQPDDLLLITGINGEYQLVLYEEMMDNDIAYVGTIEGGSLTNILSVEENFKYQGDWDEIKIKYAEYFI